MALEFIANPSTTDVLMIVVVFLLFVMGIKKVMNVITDVIMVSVAAIIIPVIGSRLLGLAIPTDVNSLINYVVVGIAAYFVYLAGKKISAAVGKAASVGGKIMPKSKKEKTRYLQRDEKPAVRYETPNRIVVNKARPKSEKEMYKNYVVLEDSDIKRVPKPKTEKKSNVESLPEIRKKRAKEE